MAHDFNPPTRRLSILAGAVLMLATLPGRTQGLGLITEPLLQDLEISRFAFAQINLWATLLGAIACLPVGLWLDQRGPRPLILVLLPILSAAVLGITLIPELAAPSVRLGLLLALVLVTRAVGQGALSVLSIGVAGRAFQAGRGGSAALFAILLSVFFMIAFSIIGTVIRMYGWQTAWHGVALSLLLVLPLARWFPRQPTSRTPSQEAATNPPSAPSTPSNFGDLTLKESLRQPLFWIYSLAIALFTAIQAGIGLFNEALLVERGFGRETFHYFLAATALIALLGQALGSATRWLPLRAWLGLALLAQGAALIAFNWVSSLPHLTAFALVMGISAGIITVAFFAIWAETFGQRHLGRIMGVAQTVTVLASAVGPLLLERGASKLGGFAICLSYSAVPSLILGVLVLITSKLTKQTHDSISKPHD